MTPPSDGKPSVTSVTSTREISYLSRPAAVSMGDGYFELATLDHFWVHRRFDVLRSLAGETIADAKNIAEIGCGNGLLQRQIELAYGREVTGCDLNAFGLSRNVSQGSPVLCYDILERNEQLRQRFDLVLLFDVLEHIAEEGDFIEAIKFHMAPGGTLVINVPAGPWAFSSYDTAAGHVRRYSIRTLRKSLEPHGFVTAKCTYWGLPLL